MDSSSVLTFLLIRITKIDDVLRRETLGVQNLKKNLFIGFLGSAT